MKKIKKSKLKKDLKKLNKDLKSIKSKKNRKNKKLACKIADDIKELNYDASLYPEDKTANLILYMLNTPFGAPFVSQKSLLDAAINYDYQTYPSSDIKHFISDIYKYDSFFNDEIFFIFDSFLKKIK